MIHYIGKIYNFNKPPEKENVIIDIPFYEQNPVSDEVLIHISKDYVRNLNSDQYKRIDKIPEKEKSIFQKNGVSVKGQQYILKKLREDIEKNYELIAWTGYPKYRQLGYILELGWSNLIREGETVSPMTLSKLNKVTYDYGVNNSINYMIKNNYLYMKKLARNENLNDEELIDISIRDSFQVVKHWLNYKVPKWLNVINSLQKLVCNEKNFNAGDYSVYASKIENDFIKNNLVILHEYGIPDTAIKKLSHFIPDRLEDEDILSFIKDNKLYLNKNLIKYEQEKIKENL